MVQQLKVVLEHPAWPELTGPEGKVHWARDLEMALAHPVSGPFDADVLLRVNLPAGKVVMVLSTLPLLENACQLLRAHSGLPSEALSPEDLWALRGAVQSRLSAVDSFLPSVDETQEVTRLQGLQARLQRMLDAP